MTRLLPFAFVLLAALALAPEAVGQRRAVAVVYDDSGSMLREGRWWYANYALQNLAGLLADDDELLLVRMSRPELTERLDLAAPSTIIETVRARPAPVNNTPTPYQALLTGMTALTNADAEEKWLVVFSDGDFEGLDEPGAADGLEAAIQRFVGRTRARTLFLLIGEDQAAVDQLARQRAVSFWRDEGQATVYTALGRTDIVRQMEQIAADITARTLERGGPTVQADGAILRVISEFPLSRLTLLEQRTDRAGALAAIQSATAEDQPLRPQPGLDVRMHDAAQVDLFGRITHITPADAPGVIPAGTLTLTTDQPVDLQTLTVLPEVAARLIVQLADADGAPLPVRNRVFEACLGEQALVRATLVDPAGDTLTHRMQRPDRIDMRLVHNRTEAAMALDAGSGFFERAVSVDSLPQPVSVSAAYPGYFNFKSQLFTLAGVRCAPPRALGLREPDAWAAPVNKIHTRDPLALYPSADGEAVSAAEFADWTLTVVNDPRLNVALDTRDDHWTIRPRRRWGLAPFTPTGPVEVEVEIASGRSKEAPARRTVVLDVQPVPFWELWGTFLLGLLALLVLLWYLIGLMRKPRFARGSGIEFRRAKGRRDLSKPFWEPLPTSWFNRWLVPYRREQRSIEGVRFIATRNAGAVLIHRSSLTPESTIGGLPVQYPGVDASETIEEDRALNSNETLVLARGRRRDTYTYVTVGR